jgi:hypothetical protein
MAKVTYVGGHDAVIVPMPFGGEQYVEKFGILNTSDEHAASLLEQASNWQPVEDEKKDKKKDEVKDD